MRLQLIPGLHRATHRIAIHLDATRPALGLTQGECHLLAHLHEAGPSSVGALHVAFAHKRSTLTSYLDRLEQAGLVTRELRREDRRSFLVSLTRAGRAAAARVHRRLAALEEAALARASERDLRGFHAVLEALQELADQAQPATGRATERLMEKRRTR
ncbi:MAG TPA: MarR family transcriptional regulator [Kofleriaceae bacterium]|nr:MarR family transcriptional regulator [Kofleriaceae bacterium]